MLGTCDCRKMVAIVLLHLAAWAVANPATYSFSLFFQHQNDLAFDTSGQL
jgi:hypothetical protein